VGGGIRPGRDALIEDLRAVTDVEVTNATSDPIATRGGRLALTRARYSRGHGEPDPFHVDFLQLVEIDAEDRITAFIAFDPDDIDAAIEELDARYLAGEAATHSHTWKALTQVQAAYNRHEFLPTTENWVNIDHRRGRAFAPGDMIGYIRATYDIAPNVKGHIEAVHRLTNIGAVATEVVTGTSQEGFDAEWREIGLFAFEGDLICRFEMFDDADLDAALARFDELHTQAPRLENAATRAVDRFFAYYRAHDWAAIAEILADGTFIENRVRVVNTGLWEGRDVVIANMQALAEGVANSTSAVLAVRGERLSLTHMRYPNSDARYGEFVPEQLIIAEIDTDDRIAAQIVIDPDDIDAAFAELDARYLAGEAAAYSQTWSVIARFNAAFNRHEIPATDWVTIDHRRLITADTSDQSALIHEVWNITPDLNIHIEAVHQLSSFGAVVTRELHGTSREGFEAEWRMIQLLTVEGDRISRSELFDEADLDGALARFQELQSPTPRRDAAL
jgi:hypothetical protein